MKRNFSNFIPWKFKKQSKLSLTGIVKVMVDNTYKVTTAGRTYSLVEIKSIAKSTENHFMDVLHIMLLLFLIAEFKSG